MTFDEIMDNALTSREEVEMVFNAQTGAWQDIRGELANMVIGYEMTEWDKKYPPGHFSLYRDK